MAADSTQINLMSITKAVIGLCMVNVDRDVLIPGGVRLGDALNHNTGRYFDFGAYYDDFCALKQQPEFRSECIRKYKESDQTAVFVYNDIAFQLIAFYALDQGVSFTRNHTLPLSHISGWHWESAADGSRIAPHGLFATRDATAQIAEMAMRILYARLPTIKTQATWMPSGAMHWHDHHDVLCWSWNGWFFNSTFTVACAIGHRAQYILIGLGRNRGRVSVMVWDDSFSDELDRKVEEARRQFANELWRWSRNLG